MYVVDIELRDPKIHAIEFVLKNTKNDKWFNYFLFYNLLFLNFISFHFFGFDVLYLWIVRLKLNGASFRIKLHEEIDASISIM